MKVTYINHSGFLIETRDCYYIFDYYKGCLLYTSIVCTYDTAVNCDHASDGGNV